MSIYVDGQEIKRIYVGGEGYIKKAYYGRSLVYEIADLFESGTNGTYTVFIDTPGIYEISICGAGGGGGGSATSHDWLGANGGSGAAFRGNVLLDRTTLTITVGKGGNGGNASGANAGRGSGGGLSRITDENSNVLITAGAGDGGHGTGNNYGGGGQGGTLTMGTAEVISYEIQSNGASSSTVSILGNGYGAGGERRSHASGTAGTNGYVRIKYVEKPQKLYAYFLDRKQNDWDAPWYSAIVYSDKLLVAGSGEPTGNTNLLYFSENLGIITSLPAATSQTTLNITSFSENGFVYNNYFPVYRVPNLDVTNGHLVDSSNPALLCYHSDEETYYGSNIYIPKPMSDWGYRSVLFANGSSWNEILQEAEQRQHGWDQAEVGEYNDNMIDVDGYIFERDSTKDIYFNS